MVKAGTTEQIYTTMGPPSDGLSHSQGIQRSQNAEQTDQKGLTVGT